MPHVSDSALKEMLKQLPREQQKTLANIIAGKVTHQVHCNSDTCQGEVIAYIYYDGINAATRQPQYLVQPAVIDGKMKLRASRKRLDGFTGFQCWCGNDSRLARQELGSIAYTGEAPSRDDLADIYSRLQRDKPNYPEIDGKRQVDGFTIERVA